jgi:Lipase (class 3)
MAMVIFFCVRAANESSSSGGALAALCSLELAMTENLCGPENISVYTFGAPKLGNVNFAVLYDGIVQSHWRCIVAGDATVTLPAMLGYTHVGNMAMFTRHGHLTLDKMVMLRWWQSETSSFPMYKLTSYYCALAAWGLAHSGKDARKIGLWKWPLDEATSSLFLQGGQAERQDRTSSVHHSNTGTVSQSSVPSSLEEADDVVAFKR